LLPTGMSARRAGNCSSAPFKDGDVHQLAIK
jgi:hypothetical protein